MSRSEFVLIKGRKQFFLTSWSKNAKELKSTKLFEIGQGDTTEEALGFKEIYFQFFYMLNKWNYLAFQLADEAFIEQGHQVQFHPDMSFKQSTPIAKMPERCMRPTIVKMRHGGENKLVFVGGFENRNCLLYTPKNEQGAGDSWRYIHKIPEGHNITTTVSCNYNDEAIFTFMTDAQLNFKSACMDLSKLDPQEKSEDNKEEMYFAYKEYQTNHKLDRFHFKCAVAFPTKKQIVVMCRGRIDGMREQISGLLLFFDVAKVDGKYELKFDTSPDNIDKHVRRCFPTIFVRQLDYMQKAGDSIVCAQDTPDEMNFQLVSVDTQRKRKCGINLQHRFYNVTDPSAQ